MTLIYIAEPKGVGKSIVEALLSQGSYKVSDIETSDACYWICKKPVNS